MSVARALRRTTRGMIAFDLVLGGAAIAAPAASGLSGR